MIRVDHPGSGSWTRIMYFTHPGFRIYRSKRHGIPDPDPQHWVQVPSSPASLHRQQAVPARCYTQRRKTKTGKEGAVMAWREEGLGHIRRQ
jgi:hypothetical protein